MTQVRAQPCTACPYRTDVPSGVWEAYEYDKLRDYDLPTPDQPAATFGCHATPDFHCHGWAVVHSSRGHAFELLAFRIWPPSGPIPEPYVALFDSGNDAADWGQRDVEDPRPEAIEVVARLQRKYPRLEQA